MDPHYTNLSRQTFRAESAHVHPEQSRNILLNSNSNHRLKYQNRARLLMWIRQLKSQTLYAIFHDFLNNVNLDIRNIETDLTNNKR